MATTPSISYALGIGSGLDIKAMVDSLAEAQKAPKDALLKKREDANAAKISTLGEVASAIDSFASALSALIAGGSLYSQPSVSDSDVFSASALPGSRLGGLSASIEVLNLAQAQTLQSTSLSSRSDPVGEGTLTISVGGNSFDVTVDAANNSLDGLARAINDRKAGVSASVITDTTGARLVIKGATGAANAFTLSVPDGTVSGLERFAFGPGVTGGMTQAQEALNANLVVDGVAVSRATNSFSDLIQGVQIDLKNAKPGTLVSVGVTRPAAAITQSVQDFVAAYNELAGMIAEATKAGVDGAGGVLRGDLGVRELQRQLRGLSTTVLNSQEGSFQTLSEIGVRTNRDGTLGVDTAKLTEALANDPDGVEALFNPSQYSSSALVTIASGVGKVKPGVYIVTNAVPADGGTPASGMINGVAATGIGGNLVARAASGAAGLILTINGAVASATITVDPGLGGALQAIRDSLRASGGPFAGSQQRLNNEAEDIADDRELLEVRSEKYYNQLLATFTNMERQVSAFKATQSYLDQQIKLWTADRN